MKIRKRQPVVWWFPYLVSAALIGGLTGAALLAISHARFPKTARRLKKTKLFANRSAVALSRVEPTPDEDKISA